MNKFISLLLVCLVLLNSFNVAFATEDEEFIEEEYTTGSLEMSPEQLSAFLSEVPMIVDVKPNQLFMERLNEASEGNANLMGGIYNVADDGEEIITNKDAIPMTVSTDVSYPSKVDNSSEKTFPVIKNQKYLNSCLGWSLAYYQLTNNANKIRGTTARSGSTNINSRVYSPNWVYNLGNKANNSGMTGDRAANVLYTYGCPSISQVSIKTSDSAANYLSWYPSASIWESALYNKCDLYYGTVNPNNVDTPVTSPSSQCLDNLKKLLAAGYVVTIETYVNSDEDNYLPITKTGKTSSNSSAYAWTEVRDTDDVSGHAVTIVGYDDNFKVDINGNGSYQEGEYGAFKVANSWGTDAYKHKNGYVWISYDALNAVSSVKSSVHSNRVPAFRNGDMYYFVKPQKEYKPLLTATIGITTDSRENIKIKLGIENKEKPSEFFEREISRTVYSDDSEIENTMTNRIAFWKGYGNYNLSGTNNESTGYVVFDLTSLLTEFEMEKDKMYNLYVKLEDDSGENEIVIESLILKDYTNSTYDCSTLPLSTGMNNDTIKADIAYSSCVTTAKKDKIFELIFNSNIDETTVNDTVVTLTNSDNEYFSLDLSLHENEKKILLNSQSGSLKNDFYTINVASDLRSKGGNRLASNISYPFYVPFH